MMRNQGTVVSRRGLVGAAGTAAAALALGLARPLPARAESAADGDGAAEAPGLPGLPAAQPDPDSPFGVDLNVNVETIDAYLGRDDAVYRDLRLFEDPAEYSSIGGDAKLSLGVEGFTVVPYPYIGSLQELPVEGAYAGERLFDVTWDGDGEVAGARAVYAESEQLLRDLFPRDKAVLLMCGGGGYAGMLRKLLIYLGWDASRVYNLGGAWFYAGDHPVLTTQAMPDGSTMRCYWRLPTVSIDFASYTPLN